MNIDIKVSETLLRIARKAAAHLNEGYRGAFEVEHKGEFDLVTRYDREAEEIIKAEIARELPGCDMIGEEGGGSAVGGRPVIYADPLDGTTNFTHGHPFYCVSLGMTLGAELLAAAVVAPALGTEYHAALGCGAFRNGAPCRVSEKTELKKSLLATGFPYDIGVNLENNLREFCELSLRTQGVRRCGSAALDLCLTADGTFDGYWERHLKPWDIAAGALIVRESGGTLTDFYGRVPDIRTGWLVASNGRIHQDLLDVLFGARIRPLITPLTP